MSMLSSALEGLVAFLVATGNPPPTRCFRIIEIRPDAPTDHRGRIRVRRTDFVEPTLYEPRFDMLLEAGLSWINVSCYGLDGENLVVGIEIPNPRPILVTPTPVNYCGPSRAVLDNEWRVDEVLSIE